VDSLLYTCYLCAKYYLILALGNQINQKRKTNRQLQKSIKRKAGELEKLFDNLRKGKAHCEMLEQKHKALQAEKATVEAKVKKCLEVLNSVD
jgi:septal ring factor EnvC (AmiA/AmiB activator)